ncbi:hypothetical protein [Pseudomonas phage vB_Pa-PAC3]
MGGNTPDGPYRSSTLRNISQFCFTYILNNVIISSSKRETLQNRGTQK